MHRFSPINEMQSIMHNIQSVIHQLLSVAVAIYTNYCPRQQKRDFQAESAGLRFPWFWAFRRFYSTGLVIPGASSHKMGLF
ncbi:hypothetical protein A1A1_12572 [Planococcus antarcticus DSM 14505]|uniref:Uncharacterized protein n=1 Tax=Planococcus antarcticus DSM 14505 TaxID=1185653 RepID=A0AA87IK02_9BACL|nr:hypothetical protein A1A1_12572 [Planococcus antarcticus DSM 14505]